MAQIFTSFLLISAIGTVLAGVLAILRPLTRKIFSANWHYYMWLVVLVVMIMPVRLNIPEIKQNTEPPSETLAFENDTTEADNIPVIIETTQEIVADEQTMQEEKTSSVQLAKDFFTGKAKVFSVIWLCGAVILFLIKIAGYLIFLAKMHKHSKPISCPEIYAYTKRKIRARMSDALSSPLVTGIFRPTLLLPEADITEEQLKNILSHEMTHLKRNDVLYKWFVGVIKCVHWFNPAIYFISRQINMDCEISCDMAVVKKMSEQEEKRYIETILSLLTHNNAKAVPLTTGMTGNKESLKKRFTMIKNKIKVKRKTAIISGILAVVMLFGAILISGIINGRFNISESILFNVNTDERKGDEFNFLMIGVDNTDKIDTIFAINFDGSNLTLMNIPRNVTLAVSEDVPADGSKRLSSLLAEKNGDQKVIDSIKETLGIPIHYYAKVKMEAIADVVDYVGGITFDVPYDMAYDDPAQDLHINLKKGNQVLNGKQVEHLLRFRDRTHPSDEEVRVMTWHSVIKEFLNQTVIGGKIKDIPAFYKIATKNIKTNYSLADLRKDFKKLTKINRNNIVVRNISGKNVNLNGYFVFHINYVESESLLEVFRAKGTTSLVSVIPYTNEVMGFKITLPVQWKSKYETIQFDNQVAFLHKDIFLKYGKGSGNLFTITKMKQPSKKALEEAGAPYEYLYSGDEYAYVWSIASDVQYPTWQDRDEEDIRLAEDFEDMMEDLNFIKNSFSLIEESPLSSTGNSILWPTDSKTISNGFGKRVHPITKEESVHNGIDIVAPENSPVFSATHGRVTETGFDSKFGNYIVIQNDTGVKTYYGHLSSIDVSKGDTVAQKDIIGKVGKTGTATGAGLHFEVQINGEYQNPEELWPQNQTETEKEKLSSTTIKSELVSDEPYTGFEHLVLENTDANKIRQELHKQGIVETDKSSVDLTKNYTVKDYNTEKTKVEADKNGNISLYLSVNSDNLFDVKFYDAKTNEDVGSYSVLANNENAYTFVGFEKGKTYNMEVQGKTKGDWAIEGSYIIY